MNPSNYTSISFPSFGIEVDPARTLSIGPLTIHYYGLVIAIGLMLAVLYASKRGKEFGIKEDDILDGVLWVTPFAIVCARIYYVAFSWEDYASNPISVLYIWEGGIAIYGGVLGAILGMYVMCRVKKVRFSTTLDLILLAFLIAFSEYLVFSSHNAFYRFTQRLGIFTVFEECEEKSVFGYDKHVAAVYKCA